MGTPSKGLASGLEADCGATSETITSAVATAGRTSGRHAEDLNSRAVPVAPEAFVILSLGASLESALAKGAMSAGRFDVARAARTLARSRRGRRVSRT